MIKVLMLDPDPIGYYGTDLANALVGAAVDVKFMTARGYSHRSQAKFKVLEVAPRSSAGGWVTKMVQEIAYWYRILWEVVSWRPDIVHIQWLRVPIEGALVAFLRLLSCRIVWTAHTSMPHVERWVDRLVYALVYKSASVVIAHASATKAEIMHEFKVHPNKVVIIPHGYHEVAPDTVGSQVNAREALGWPKDPTVFLFMGQLRAYKGYTDLLDAFGEAAGRGGDAILAIAGRATGPVAEEVSRILDAMPGGVRERIRLRVVIDEFLPSAEMDLHLKASDCVILPYRRISQSGILHEARGRAKAVVATRIGGFPEAIRDGIDGWLYSPGDNEALAGLLARLDGRRDELLAAGQEGRANAERAFGWPLIGRKTKRLYITLLGSAEAEVEE